MLNRCSIALDKKVDFLSRNSSYPAAPHHVERVETHMAYVFLTDQYAWKLKKPVKTDFLDFSTIEKRRIDCEEEVRLNRRLAAEIYLGVVPLTCSPQGALYLGGDGQRVDWLVQMQRLPQQQALDSRIRGNRVRPEDVRRVVRRLCSFYRSAAPVPMAAGEYPAQLTRSIDDNACELAAPSFELDGDTVRSLTAWQHEFVRQHRDLLNSRVSERRVVDAHGDLRPEHIFLLDPPVVIDCLEFNRALRVLDAVSELAFLGLECQRVGAAWIEDEIFATYGAATADAPPHELVSFYRVWHACSRAKISLWHVRDGLDDGVRWKHKARQYLQLAAGSRAAA